MKALSKDDNCLHCGIVFKIPEPYTDYYGYVIDPDQHRQSCPTLNGYTILTNALGEYDVWHNKHYFKTFSHIPALILFEQTVYNGKLNNCYMYVSQPLFKFREFIFSRQMRLTTIFDNVAKIPTGKLLDFFIKFESLYILLDFKRDGICVEHYEKQQQLTDLIECYNEQP